MLMTADFKRAHSCFLIATRPLEGKTLCEGVVFTRRTHNPLMRCLWQPLSLMVRRWLTYEFVADESRNLLRIRYNLATLIKGDGTMADFFSWLAQLPGHRQDVLRQEVSVPARMAQPANFG
jgi:hypothetical protein